MPALNSRTTLTYSLSMNFSREMRCICCHAIRTLCVWLTWLKSWCNGSKWLLLQHDELKDGALINMFTHLHSEARVWCAALTPLLCPVYAFAERGPCFSLLFVFLQWSGCPDSMWPEHCRIRSQPRDFTVGETQEALIGTEQNLFQLFSVWSNLVSF